MIVASERDEIRGPDHRLPFASAIPTAHASGVTPHGSAQRALGSAAAFSPASFGSPAPWQTEGSNIGNSAFGVPSGFASASPGQQRSGGMSSPQRTRTSGYASPCRPSTPRQASSSSSAKIGFSSPVSVLTSGGAQHGTNTPGYPGNPSHHQISAPSTPRRMTSAPISTSRSSLGRAQHQHRSGVGRMSNTWVPSPPLGIPSSHVAMTAPSLPPPWAVVREPIAHSTPKRAPGEPFLVSPIHPSTLGMTVTPSLSSTPRSVHCQPEPFVHGRREPTHVADQAIYWTRDGPSVSNAFSVGRRHTTQESTPAASSSSMDGSEADAYSDIFARARGQSKRETIVEQAQSGKIQKEHAVPIVRVVNAEGQEHFVKFKHEPATKASGTKRSPGRSQSAGHIRGQLAAAQVMHEASKVIEANPRKSFGGLRHVPDTSAQSDSSQHSVASRLEASPGHERSVESPHHPLNPKRTEKRQANVRTSSQPAASLNNVLRQWPLPA